MMEINVSENVTTAVVGGTTVDVALSENITTITLGTSVLYAPTAGTAVFAESTDDVQQYVKAGVPIVKGQAVYVTGATGTNVIVGLAQANTDPNSSKTLGLALQTLATNDFGYVVTNGYITGIDTSAAQAGDPVWLSPSTPGGIVFGTANKPSAPNHQVYLGVVVRANQNNGSIYVTVQNGFELQELHNVAINGVANNDIIKYNSATQLWVNASQAPLAGTATYATTAGSATTASTALTAGTSSYASLAGTSTFATTATTAGSATNAGSALTAGTASYATVAGTATFATSATTSGSATNAGSALTAGTSSYATLSGTAVFSSTSGTASYSTTSGTATFATNAGTSVFASTSGTAVYATTAGTAVNISGTIAPSQVTGTAAVLGANTFVAAQILSPTAGVALTANGVTDAVTLIVKGGASNTAALQQWQTSAATVATVSSSGAFTLSPSSGTALTVNGASSAVTMIVKGGASGTSNVAEWWGVGNAAADVLITSAGQFAVGQRVTVGSTAISSLAHLTSSSTSAGRVGYALTGVTGQTADLMQYVTTLASGTVLGGRNALAQIYTGSTAPVTVATGGATTAASGTGTTATITTTNAHGLAVGDLVTVAGVTPTGYNATAVVSAVTTNTFSYANTTTGSQTVAGTVSVPAQASLTPRSAGTVGLVVKGAASQSARLSQWQNSSGNEVVYITAGGTLGAAGNYIQLTAENSGGEIQMTKQTAAGTNPGASKAILYFRDGTNANTLKLVVRAGTAGAETTILDNIPT